MCLHKVHKSACLSLHLIRFVRLNLCVPTIVETRCKGGKEMLGNANKTEQWETGAGVCLLGVGGKQLLVTGLGIIVSSSVLNTQYLFAPTHYL